MADAMMQRARQLDEAAVAAYTALSNSSRKKIRGEEFKQMCLMRKEDINVLLLKTPEPPAPPLPPAAAFRTGQSVWQWWASWMHSADKPVTKYSKKQRPAWYAGEINTAAGVQTHLYCGFKMTCHWYHVF